MSSTAARLALPIPKPMRTLERDSRGYPIPFIVLRAADGAAHFPVNDVRRVASCFSKRLCGICGKRLERTCWFVGGPGCFGADDGGFLDPPNHHDCAEYALRVCPFLAAPSYGRFLNDRKVVTSDVPSNMTIATSATASDKRPTIFGLGETGDYYMQPMPGQPPLFGVGSWEFIEYWRFGARCDAPATPMGD